MIGLLSQTRALQRVISGGVSAKLLARVTKIGQPEFSGVVPAGATWMRMGATGGGLYGAYDEGYSFYPGQGGAYAYNEIVVAPGQPYKISSTVGGDVTITVNGVVVCKGAGATTQNYYTRVGGSAANCIGLYARSAGQFGGAAGQGSGPGGDSDKVDGIGVWGNSSQPIGPGGAGVVYNTSQGVPAGPAAGVVEFWSAKR